MEDIAKELRERRRVLRIYNKRREDFASKADWDDYLENLEDVAYNLINRIDMNQTEAKLQLGHAHPDLQKLFHHKDKKDS